MIPRNSNTEEVEQIRIINHNTLTYRLEFERNRIRKHTDTLEAMEQFVYKVLNTERYKYLIYNWNYGVEIKNLFGKPIPFVKAELPRRITESLITDNRVTSVRDFVFINTNEKNTVKVEFTVETVFGDIKQSKQISI